MPETYRQWIEVLRRAALSGSEAIRDNYNLESRHKVTKRGAGGDLTLEIDEASESAIQESLSRDLGKDNFVFMSEEIGEVRTNGNSELPIVICDPLDGSHNAQVGLPLFSISLSVIGIKSKVGVTNRRLEDVEIGLVLNVPTQDEFYAIKNQGAYHNGILLQKSSDDRGLFKRFETLGIECGDVNFLKEVMAVFSTNNVYKLRVLGSAALSYCMLADGTFDAFIFVQPNGARTIDSPAGYLIAREAGCVFANLSSELAVSDAEIGFNSRINIGGTRNEKLLTRLLGLFRDGRTDPKHGQ